jgi:hypothetical protein
MKRRFDEKALHLYLTITQFAKLYMVYFGGKILFQISIKYGTIKNVQSYNAEKLDSLKSNN